MPKSHMRVLVLSQLPSNVPVKGEEHGPSACCDTRVGDLEGVIGSRCSPDSVSYATAIWGVSQCI